MSLATRRGRTDAFRRLTQNLRLPVIVAPMFTISGPQLVMAACRAGVTGAFPAACARTIEDLQAWMERISGALGPADAPWTINVIVHRSNGRLGGEIELIRTFQPPLVISSLGTPARVADAVHGYGGLLFGDVTSPRFAKKALAAGADGLVLVCSGAGGHTGEYSPFAFVAEIRKLWGGPIVLAGAITNARSLWAAKVLGADLAYMGTAFIAAEESLAVDGYGRMLIDSDMEDTLATDVVTGIKASWLVPSLERAGLMGAALEQSGTIDFSSEKLSDMKVWKELWGAGQGVGSVQQLAPVAEIVARLYEQYNELSGGRE